MQTVVDPKPLARFKKHIISFLLPTRTSAIILLMVILSINISGLVFIPFVEAQSSCASLAMGFQNDVVNIWSGSSLSSLSNPALSAISKSLTYSTNKFPYKPFEDTSGQIYTSSMTYGQNGFGFTIPSYNRDYLMGMTARAYFNSDLEGGGDELFLENSQTCGIAYNPFHLLRTKYPENDIFKHIDFAIGINHISGTGYERFSSAVYFDGSYQTLGAVARVDIPIKNYLRMEGVLGYSRTNCFNVKVTPDWLFDKVAIINNPGFAASISVPLNAKGGALKDHVNNFISARYFQAYQSTHDTIKPATKAQGCEIGLLDTIFYRCGKNRDIINNHNSSSEGWGLKLHYKDLISYTYNIADFHLLFGNKVTASEHNLNLNFLELIEFLHL